MAVSKLRAALARGPAHLASRNQALANKQFGSRRSDPRRFEMVAMAEAVRKLCEEGHLAEAVEALGVLVHTDSCISIDLLYTVLKKCVAQKDLVLGRLVHAFTVKKGHQSDTFLCNHILRMYGAHGRMQDAMDVFTLVPKPDAFMWSSMISAYVHHGHYKHAIQLYRRMSRSGAKPDSHVFVAALQACVKEQDLETVREVHGDVVASGFERDAFVCSCLVDIYAKCGRLGDARAVFDRVDGDKGVVIWTAMIAGYSQHGMGQEALRLYSVMQEEGMAVPNSVTFVCLLQACASVGTPALEKGKQLHAQIKELGHQSDGFVGSSLVNMYAKCGSLEDAQKVFDGLVEKDVVTWNAMLAACSQQGLGHEALRLYSVMQKEGTATPDSVTYVCLLQACANMGIPALEKGKELHAQVEGRGHQDVFVASSLVNMYAKCGSLEDAQGVFDGLSKKDVVTWTAIIAGYSQQGMGQKALHLYSAMQADGMAVSDAVTFVCLLQACASVGPPVLETGKQLHEQIREREYQADVFVANSLVNMYAKCGSLEDAQAVFDRLAQKDVVTWNALIGLYAKQGLGQEALCLYSAMQKEGIALPDSVTFVYVLQACANMAALHLGRQLHAQIEEQGFQADVVVGRSLINMYGKAGSMVDAQKVFDALVDRTVATWNALIAGYSHQGDSDEVFHLVLRMRGDGIQPDGITFLGVLTVCSHTGLVNKGREYFDAMKRLEGITPTVEHYTCMVDLLGRAGQLDEALALVRTMPVVPDAVIWSTLLGACGKWRDVEVGRHAFNQAVKLDKKDATAYLLMSKIYTGARMWEQAQHMHAKRVRRMAWKQPGQSWWTDMDGLVHSFSVS